MSENEEILQTANESPSKASRRTAAPAIRSQTTPRKHPLWFVIFGLILFVTGTGAGAFFMRQRYHARQIVASINGTIIRDSDFYRRLEVVGGKQALQQMAAEELQLQYAQKQGVFPTNAEVEAKYRQVNKDKDFARNLTMSGQNEYDVRRAIRLELAAFAIANKGRTVTEAEVREYYRRYSDKKNPQSIYYSPAISTIAVIVTPTEQKANEASTLMRQTNFANAAKKYSEDENSKKNGGLLPPIPYGMTRAKGVPGLEEAVFRLKIGETSEPRKFANKWWIIRCVDKTPEKVSPFEEVNDDCKRRALLAKALPNAAKQVSADFESYKKKALIQVFWRQYQDALQKN